MKAYRIAKLEIEGEYKEEIHNEYFEHFSWYRLLPEELRLFYPIVVVVNQPYIFDHLNSLSSLMASNKPIKVVVLNHEHISTPNQQMRWEDASHQFRQEIAALAMAHRNVYTFQSSMADPSSFYQGLTNCFNSTAPGICHLSVPSKDVSSKMSHFLLAEAANASRYFPAIQYDPAKSTKWGGRFDLTDNIQPEVNWPSFTLKVQTSDNKEIEIDAAFTYADYKACFKEKVQELMLVPDEYYTEYLIPLSEYLESDEASLYGKIPFIWLTDEKMELHRAAVPNVWVVSCQERLDFWYFLQELGGFNTAKEKESMEQKELEMKRLLEEQKAKLEQDHQQIIETAQEDAVAKAAERLVTALLNDEDL
jgi:pyruvate-ferredoxin/flavodoxin oxidoreductase